jgi:large subunit ribosomal protein L23
MNNNLRIMSLLLAPHVSEKTTVISDKNNQFVFRVVSDATKLEIKQAVEFLFKTEVDSVKVLNVKGKCKKFRQKLGRRKDWKKAYVSLKDGQNINFTATE